MIKCDKCEVVEVAVGPYDHGGIRFCPLHEAAPELLKTVKRLQACEDVGINEVDNLISRAEGR